MLKMKKACEKCGASTGLTEVAYICSYECTFCESCADEMDGVCPNCDGHLVVRPTREKSPIAAGAAQTRRKLFGGRR